MEPGLVCFRLNVLVTPSKTEAKSVKIPVDAVIQPQKAKLPHLPVLVEAKRRGISRTSTSAGKEEATKINPAQGAYVTVFVLFLCGYFDAAYLGYEAAEGIDWIWEHRMGTWISSDSEGMNGSHRLTQRRRAPSQEQARLDRLKTSSERNKLGNLLRRPSWRSVLPGTRAP